MKIVIDLQAAQGLSRYRGIGRYSLALTKALVRNSRNHEIIVALNGMLEESVDPLRATLEELMPREHIKIWYGAAPTRPLEKENKWRREASRLAREAFLANMKPDIVLVTSLFEGVGDSAVHSIGEIPKSFPTAVIFYDLIPLLEREKYLDGDQRIESYYFDCLSHLRNADLFLSISESSKQELVANLGIPPDRVYNISAAAESHFTRIGEQLVRDNSVHQKFGIKKSFVMYSGATDERKNHKRLIEAFAQLSAELRAQYQLAIVGKINEADRSAFMKHAGGVGLEPNEVVITGEVSDRELVHLYNTTDLFVFPSWHEGFGLPALEAMACGAAVIASNTTSLPEVVGRPDSLFDPFNVEAIAAKMTEVLSDKTLRMELAQASSVQAEKFSWDKTANLALCAFEEFGAREKAYQIQPSSGRRRKLAFFSPLPPEKTGIADYAAELLPELAAYYDVYIITSQKKISDDWITAHCNIRDIEWFNRNHFLFSRVLYQFGNSPYHYHMLDLLEKKPGVVILHDFYISAMLRHVDPRLWLLELYRSHGYPAVAEVGPLVEAGDELSNFVGKYPSNAVVTDPAVGVIVHSEYSRSLGRDWGNDRAEKWKVVPLLRASERPLSREEARIALGIDPDDFVICSFGFLDPVKQNERLLAAFANSALAQSTRTRVYFVGENHAGAYGRALEEAIHTRRLSDRVVITGWVSSEDYQKYAAAADLGVQLRASSRGEVSAAVLDCMKFGLPTIVNANGSLAELADDSVYMLADEFEDGDLRVALEELWRNKSRRVQMGENAQTALSKYHSPRACARAYADAIESFYRDAAPNDHLIDAIGKIDAPAPAVDDLAAVCEAIAFNSRSSGKKQLLVDVSALVRTSLKTGVERVVDKVLREFIANAPQGYRVEPVYADTQNPGYRYARQFCFSMLGADPTIVSDEPIIAYPGDIFLGLDLEQYVVAAQKDYYKKLKRDNVDVYFIVYDLLPVLLPECFPSWAEKAHEEWLRGIESATGLIAISRTVADELAEWIRVHGRRRERPLKMGWFHLGADMEVDEPKAAIQSPAVKSHTTVPTFLMVGTIEPRKGHLQVLEAFEELWSSGVEAKLVIVGAEGWKGLAPSERRVITQTVDKIKGSKWLNKRLFWHVGIRDAELANWYQKADCLIAASYGEGFGLPLIEASRHGLPILARDLPVFREVAGSDIAYFNAPTGTVLAQVILKWIQGGQHGQRKAADVTWLTWTESKAQLEDVIIGGNWYKEV